MPLRKQIISPTHYNLLSVCRSGRSSSWLPETMKGRFPFCHSHSSHSSPSLSDISCLRDLRVATVRSGGMGSDTAAQIEQVNADVSLIEQERHHVGPTTNDASITATTERILGGKGLEPLCWTRQTCAVSMANPHNTRHRRHFSPQVSVPALCSASTRRPLLKGPLSPTS